MKYFISSLGFRSKNVTSILNRNILLLKKNMYSVQLCVVNLWLYLSVCFCHVYVYDIQLCVVNLSLYVVCMLCQVNMYSMQLCAVNFDSMLYEGLCHDYIYSIPLCDVNLWLHFVFVVLSWAYALHSIQLCAFNMCMRVFVNM